MNKGKLIKIILLFYFIHISLAVFYFVFEEIKLKVNVYKPALELTLNKNNYYLSSKYSNVIEEKEIGKKEEINIELNGTNIIVIPVSHEINTVFDMNFNISFVFYSNITDSSNLFQIFLARAYNYCYNTTYLGKIETLEGNKSICGFYSISDKDKNSEFFGEINYKINKFNNKDYLIVIRTNPFYQGSFLLTFKVIVNEYW